MAFLLEDYQINNILAQEWMWNKMPEAKQSSVSDMTSLLPVLILLSVVSVGGDRKITSPENAFFLTKSSGI